MGKQKKTAATTSKQTTTKDNYSVQVPSELQQLQLQQLYDSNIAKIQQQSQAAYDSVNSSSQAALAALTQQLAQSEQQKNDYGLALQEYLKNMQQMQQEFTNKQLLREEQLTKQQTMQTNESQANNNISNLLAASTVAKQSFKNKTARKGFIG